MALAWDFMNANGSHLYVKKPGFGLLDVKQRGGAPAARAEPRGLNGLGPDVAASILGRALAEESAIPACTSGWPVSIKEPMRYYGVRP